uniref:Pentatricopeptide repeat-containing protein n=1 Tax=Tanacetum cinerariifolium TaxID=118510 RepID=A0A6L2KUT1_TANCI|nr:pentatricopeptide repeat-containing protein [Tanacetum cinerariifolium]
MAPSGSPFLIFDVHYDGTFNFMPLRYDNGLVYQWCVRKDNELDIAIVCDFLRQETEFIILLVDKGKGIMVNERKAGRKTAKSTNNGIVIGENVKPTFSEDDDSDSDKDMKQRFEGIAELEEMYNGNTDSESGYSDKSIDYLSEGEDELISLRKRNTKAKKNPNQNNINSSTPVVGCSRPNRVYDVGESDTVIEHEEYMDKLMHRLRDKGDVLTDSFIILENDQSNEKFPIHDEHTHWK